MICKICGINYNGILGLCKHITRSHNITIKIYYDTYLKIKGEDICNNKECTNETTFINLREGYCKYCSYKCIHKGKTSPLKGKTTSLKGKTYEEIHGTEKALELKISRSKTSKDRVITEEWRKNISKNMKEKGCGIGIKNGMWRKTHTKKVRRKQKEYMMNGGAAHARSFMKRISKPQRELFKLICSIAPYPVLEYPCLNKNIDIAIPKLSIAIEYDDSYWHQNKKSDISRQKLIEEEGWEFIRYRDYIPNKKELITDINNILNIRK